MISDCLLLIASVYDIELWPQSNMRQVVNQAGNFIKVYNMILEMNYNSRFTQTLQDHTALINFASVLMFQQPFRKYW